jgi:uncharacterized protein with HEPN domain
MRDPAERLRDILEAIAAIARHAKCDRESFDKNELLQTWFLRHLQIVGEAATAVPEDVRSLAPEIPWRQITGMRNVLVHGYFEVDTDLVWDAVTRDLPILKPAIERLLTLIEKTRKPP